MFPRSFAALLLSGIALAISSAFAFRSPLAMSSRTVPAPPSTIAQVEKIAAFGGIDVGGVEYMVDDRDGRIVYYDINALSNFVANAPQLLAFDPHARLVDYLEQQKERV